MLHEGHLEFLKTAKQLGDKLYVIVLPDRHALGNKKRIENTESVRCGNLMETGLVGKVFFDSLTDGLKCFNYICPSIFCFGYDQNTKWEYELTWYLSARFPHCQTIRMPVFANGIHSSDLRDKK